MVFFCHSLYFFIFFFGLGLGFFFVFSFRVCMRYQISLLCFSYQICKIHHICLVRFNNQVTSHEIILKFLNLFLEMISGNCWDGLLFLE